MHAIMSSSLHLYYLRFRVSLLRIAEQRIDRDLSIPDKPILYTLRRADQHNILLVVYPSFRCNRPKRTATISHLFIALIYLLDILQQLANISSATTNEKTLARIL